MAHPFRSCSNTLWPPPRQRRTGRRRIPVSLAWAVASALFAAALPCSSAAAAQSSKPHIVGVADIGYYVSDMKKARDYYGGLLGFQVAFAVKNPDGSDKVAFMKINDHQYIELYAEPPTNHGLIHDAGFETNDARGMRGHLAAIGVKVPPKVAKDAAGNLIFDILDPAGFTIRIVQYLPRSKTGRARGKFMPADRISDHIDHIGLLENDKQATWKFYSEALGFTKENDGTKMAIPGSTDRFEVGWERKARTPARYHIKDHICLSNIDVPKLTAELQAKPRMKEFPGAIADIHQLRNGKHVIEIYDADHNRVEVMEPPKAD